MGRSDAEDARKLDAADATDGTDAPAVTDATDASDADDDDRDATDATDVADVGGTTDANDVTDGGASDGGRAEVDAAKPFFVLAGRYGHATTDIGDVNGDGKLDLVSFGTDTQVWLGRGNGTFSNEGVASSLGWTFTGPRYLGRFDKVDGADIATVELLPSTGGFVGGFIGHMASGQADGTFRKAPLPTLGGSRPAEYFVVGPGDFTGDGFDDLLIVGGACGGASPVCGGASAATAPTYFVATAFDPTYAAKSFVPTAGTVVPTPRGLPTVYATFGGGIGDVDGDGKLDFCLSTTSAWLGGAGAVQRDGYVVYGKGDGTFDERKSGLSPAPFTPGQSAPSRLVDLDGDGRADWPGGGSVQWNDAGKLTAVAALPYAFLEVGDFNGDSVPDLWGSGGAQVYAAAPGDGHRGFGSPLGSASLAGGIKTIARDIDKDGATDLVIVDATSTSIYLSTAKKEFAGPADVQCACGGPTGF